MNTKFSTTLLSPSALVILGALVLVSSFVVASPVKAADICVNPNEGIEYDVNITVGYGNAGSAPAGTGWSVADMVCLRSNASFQCVQNSVLWKRTSPQGRNYIINNCTDPGNGYVNKTLRTVIAPGDPYTQTFCLWEKIGTTTSTDLKLGSAGTAFALEANCQTGTASASMSVVRPTGYVFLSRACAAVYSPSGPCVSDVCLFSNNVSVCIPTTQCSDNIDNDNDGAIDYPSDFSCSSATDTDETNPKSLCQDGLDNDGDSLVDYPQDPGCFSKQDNDESNSTNLVASCTALPNPAQINQAITFTASAVGGVGNYTYAWSSGCVGTSQSCSNTFANSGTYTAFLTVTSGNQTVNNFCNVAVNQITTNTTTQCSDNIDNDNDGAIDYPSDFSCSSATDTDETNPKSLCQDGLDNDGDSLVDYPQDPGCFSKQDNSETNATSTIACFANSQCGTNGLSGGLYCQGNGIYQNLLTNICVNPGTSSSFCAAQTSTPSFQSNCANNQTCNSGSCIATTNNLNISCYASPSSTPINQSVSFIATVSGGTGSYTYSWSGSCNGYAQNCYNSFYNSGNYTAYVNVASGSQTNSANCSVNVNQPLNTCTNHSYQQCVNNGVYNNGVYWFNSCNQQQELVQQCYGNQTCQNNTCVSQNQTLLSAVKTVKNLSLGNSNWSTSINASPNDMIQFSIAITSSSSQVINNVTVKDSLATNLIYRNNVTLDGFANSGNIISGVNIGSISPGQTKTINYQSQVAPGQNFSFGTTTLNN